jgi:hypothetical protein
MSKLLRVLLLLSCSVALADEPAVPPTAPAKIRIAGIFIKKFSVWHAELPNCAKPAGKPWMFLDCGFSTCPEFPVLDIPLELNYSNWRLSPRVTEVKIDAGMPFTMHLGGKYVHVGLAGGVAAAAGVPFILNKDSCIFDVRFTPRAGAMYEASVDPQGNGCALSLTEIRLKASGGDYERVAVEGAEVKSCPK